MSHSHAANALLRRFEPSELIGVQPLQLPRIRDGAALTVNSPAWLIWAPTAQEPPIAWESARRFRYLSIALAAAGARRWGAGYPWIRCETAILGPHEIATMCAAVD